MGFIKTFLLKSIGTEKTESKVYKILNILFSIAALFIFIFGFIRMKYMDAISLKGLGVYVSSVLLWVIVLALTGVFFYLYGEIITIKNEIKNLKDKIKE